MSAQEAAGRRERLGARRRDHHPVRHPRLGDGRPVSGGRAESSDRRRGVGRGDVQQRRGRPRGAVPAPAAVLAHRRHACLQPDLGFEHLLSRHRAHEQLQHRVHRTPVRQSPVDHSDRRRQRWSERRLLQRPGRLHRPLLRRQRQRQGVDPSPDGHPRPEADRRRADGAADHDRPAAAQHDHLRRRVHQQPRKQGDHPDDGRRPGVVTDRVRERAVRQLDLQTRTTATPARGGIRTRDNSIRRAATKGATSTRAVATRRSRKPTSPRSSRPPRRTARITTARVRPASEAWSTSTILRAAPARTSAETGT